MQIFTSSPERMFIVSYIFRDGLYSHRQNNKQRQIQMPKDISKGGLLCTRERNGIMKTKISIGSHHLPVRGRLHLCTLFHLRIQVYCDRSLFTPLSMVIATFFLLTTTITTTNSYCIKTTTSCCIKITTSYCIKTTTSCCIYSGRA